MTNNFDKYIRNQFNELEKSNKAILDFDKTKTWEKINRPKKNGKTKKMYFLYGIVASILLFIGLFAGLYFQSLKKQVTILEAENNLLSKLNIELRKNMKTIIKYDTVEIIKTIEKKINQNIPSVVFIPDTIIVSSYKTDTVFIVEYKTDTIYKNINQPHKSDIIFAGNQLNNNNKRTNKFIKIKLFEKHNDYKTQSYNQFALKVDF